MLRNGKRKLQFVLSLFIVFLFVFSAFLMVNVDAKTDYHIEYAGGVIALADITNEHIVMDDNGNKLGIAFIGRNGDSTYVNFQYRDLPYVTWDEEGIRQTTNLTFKVAISRDSAFNIHAVYMEGGGDGKNYLYYKFFQWSNKKWYLSPKAVTLSPKDSMGYNLSVVSWHVGDIKVDTDGNIHIIYGEYDTISETELLYKRYNSSIDAWDLTLAIDGETTTQYIYDYQTMAIDSNNHIYCIYNKKQVGHYSEDYYNTWFTKSVDGGDSWGDPSSVVTRTYPDNVLNGRLIIDNQDILHFVYNANYSHVNHTIIYGKSINYGTSWSYVDVTTNVSYSYGASVVLDLNNILYFVYTSKHLDTETYGLYGKKYENGILGNEILITNKHGANQLSLNLVFSNTYNQYANNGIIGIYEDRSIANYDIRYLEMDYEDFLTGYGFFEIEIIPDKPIYYVYDTITIKTNVLSGSCYWSRIYDNNGDYVNSSGWFFYLKGTYNDMWTIPDGYIDGTWTIRMYLDAGCFIPPDWDNDTYFDFEFNVKSSGLDYYIELSPDYIEIPNTVDVKFSAKAGELYNLMLIKVNTGEPVGNLSIPTVGVTQDYVITNAFMIENSGTYFVKLINDTSGLTYAVSNVIKASIHPQYPTYRTNLKNEYSYTDTIQFAIYSDSIKQYRWYVFNEREEIIGMGKYSGDVTVVRIYVDSDDIGTCYLLVYDYDGSPSDTNGLYVEFQIYDPDVDIPLTGDPLTDYLITVPSFWKGIIGLAVVLLFTFSPLIAVRKLGDAGIKFKVDIPAPLYTICCGIGAVITLIFQLWSIEYVFFICVMAAVGTLALYFIGQRNNGG